MRKLIFLFVCVSLALPCGAKADVNLVNLVKKIQPAIVTVITYDEEKNLLDQASGFFIDKKGHLITNYHVLNGAYIAEIKTFDGKKYPVRLVVAENEDIDLIKLLVDIPEKAVKFVQVAKAIPEVAERVIVVGGPMGLEQTVSEGIVSAVRDTPTIGKMFQIYTPVSPGSSGSAVVNKKVQVIGITTFQLTKGQKLNFAVSGEQVLALKSAKKGKTLAERTSSVSQKKIDVAGNVYQQGLKFLRAGEYEKALDCFKKSTEVNKRFGEAWFSVGYCYSKLGRYQEAIEAFKQAIRIKPDYADAHYNLGFTYGKLGRNQEAIESFKQTIRIKPDYADAHYNLGFTYSKLGHYQEAIEPFKQTIRIKPDYADAHYAVGVNYDALRRYQEAIESFKQAIDLRPDYADAHFGLGITYLLLGDKGSALEEHKILKTLNKDRANKLFNLIYE